MANSSNEPPIITIPRIFLDTSVIYAGLGSRTGASHAVLVMAEIGMLQAIACPYILDEVERNLTAKAPDALPRYHETMRNIRWEIVADPSIDEVKMWIPTIRAKDAPVLAAAVNAKPHRLLTLDKRDFTEVVATRSGLKIVAPGTLVHELRTIIATGFDEDPQT